jgi:hypothetical protein
MRVSLFPSMELKMPVQRKTIPEIAADLDVSSGRVRRAAKLLGFSTERGALFSAVEVKRIVKQIEMTSARAK